MMKRDKTGDIDFDLNKAAQGYKKTDVFKNDGLKILQGNQVTGERLATVITQAELREIYSRKKSVKKVALTCALTGIVGGSVIAMQYNKAPLNAIEKVMHKDKVVSAPEALFGDFITPVRNAEGTNNDSLVTYHTEKGAKVYSPIEGVVKVADGQVSVKGTEYSAVLENVSTKMENGTKVALGEKIGSSNGKVEMKIVQNSNDILVKKPGLVAMNIGEKQKNVLVEKATQQKVNESINTLEPNIKEFLNAFGPELADSFEEYGILPSTIAAQGILESSKGTSELAINAKNLFGHKAKDDWKGGTYTKVTKEVYDGKEMDVPQKFRAYDTWEDSIIGHLEWLQKDIYKDAIGEKDYKKQIQEIKNAGYATDPDYVEKVVNIINKYDLTKLNDIVLNKENTSFSEVAKMAVSDEALVKKTMKSYKENVGVDVTPTANAKENAKEKEKEKVNKNKPVYISDATVDNAVVKVELNGSEITLDKLDVSNLSSKEAYNIVNQLKTSGDYKIVKNVMLEKLLQLLNNKKMDMCLTGKYPNKMLDTLVELADPLIGKTDATKSEEMKIKSLLKGKVAFKANEKTYVIDNEKGKAELAIKEADKIKSISKDYATPSFPEQIVDFEGKDIVLDAGHSNEAGEDLGYDPGALTSVNSKDEGNITYEIIGKLAKELEKRNSNVTVIQPDGKHKMTAGFRGPFANNLKNKPDLFISLHLNSGGNETQGGSQVHYQEKNNSTSVQKYQKSKKLAEDIQKYQAKALYTIPDRGLNYSENLAVNRQTTMPSILIEAAFVSDPYQNILVENEVVQQSMVNAYIKGIADYFGLESKDVKKPEESTKVKDTKEEKPDKSTKAEDSKEEKPEEPTKVEDSKEEKPKEPTKVEDSKEEKPEEPTKVEDSKGEKPEEPTKVEDSKEEKPEEPTKVEDSKEEKPEEPTIETPEESTKVEDSKEEKPKEPTIETPEESTKVEDSKEEKPEEPTIETPEESTKVEDSKEEKPEEPTKVEEGNNETKAEDLTDTEIKMIKMLRMFE